MVALSFVDGLEPISRDSNNNAWQPCCLTKQTQRELTRNLLCLSSTNMAAMVSLEKFPRVHSL